MRTDRLLILLLISLAILLPLLLLPFIGAGVVATVERVIEQGGPSLRDGPPVRLLSGPMLGPGGRQGGAVYLQLSLPSPAAAERMCQLAPVLLDGFHVYAAEHPQRMDPRRSGAERDPSLTQALQKVVPWVPVDAARLLEMHQYLNLIQKPDVFLCRGRAAHRTVESSGQ